MSWKAYQTLECNTAGNTKRKDFKNQDSYLSSNHFIFGPDDRRVKRRYMLFMLQSNLSGICAFEYLLPDDAALRQKLSQFKCSAE